MKKKEVFDPRSILNSLCIIVLAFIPINMIVTPTLDYFLILESGSSWTVTMSAFAFVLLAGVLFAVALFFMKSRNEKVFLFGAVVFFLYAFLHTMNVGGDLVFQLIGLTSLMGATVVGILFYVSAREGLIGARAVFYVFATVAVLSALPLLLVSFDVERFERLTQEFGAISVLYGYENPRALGWASTIGLSIVAGYVTTQHGRIRNRSIYLLLATVAATVLLWTGSRGGMVAFTLSILFVLAFSQTKNRNNFFAILCCMVVGGAVSLLFYIPSGSYGLFIRIGQTIGAESVAAASSGRFDIWQNSVAYILERPFKGFGYLPNTYLKGLNHGSAHNIILEFWLGFGILVGSAVLLFAFYLWLIAFQYFRRANDQFVAALFCMVTTLMVYSMVSGPYARTFPLMLFTVAFGVILGRRSAMLDRRQVSK